VVQRAVYTKASFAKVPIAANGHHAVNSGTRESAAYSLRKRIRPARTNGLRLFRVAGLHGPPFSQLFCLLQRRVTGASWRVKAGYFRLSAQGKQCYD
jgi:hypothetical protein